MQLEESSRIAVVRRERGHRQTDLCRLAGLSLSTLRNAERGIATRRTLRLLARALEVSIDELTRRRESRR